MGVPLAGGRAAVPRACGPGGPVGPVEAAERVLRGAVCAQLARHTEARRDIDCTAEDLDRIGRLVGRLITPDAEEWPALAFTAFNGVDLRHRPAGVAPLALWAFGGAQIDQVALRAAAIVATRAAHLPPGNKDGQDKRVKFVHALIDACPTAEC